MRIISKIGLLSVLIVFSLAFSTLWVLPSAADSAGPTKGKAKYTQTKSHKAVKKTVRAKKLNAGRVQTATNQASPTTVCYTCPPGTTAYSWNTAATYGGGSTEPQAQVSASQTQLTVPLAQTVQAPTTVCYNPCVSCWNVPTYTWNVPATSGNTSQGVLQRILPPLPRPGGARSAVTQPQASVAQAPAQPQTSATQTTVCPSLVPSWWPSWASLCN